MKDFKTQVLTIDGMQGDGCVRRVMQALGSVPGVRVSTVHVGHAEVLAEPACEPGLRAAVEKAGFTFKGMNGEG